MTVTTDVTNGSKSDLIAMAPAHADLFSSSKALSWLAPSLSTRVMSQQVDVRSFHEPAALVGHHVTADDVRCYVSNLWADDWDSPEDQLYDEM